MRTNFDITIKTTNYPSWIQPSISNQLKDGEEISNFRINSNDSETVMFVSFDLALRTEDDSPDDTGWVLSTISEELYSDEEIIGYTTATI